MKYISVPVFLLSLALGLLSVYLIQPDMKEVLVFPTPENVHKTQYVDNTDTCFEFKPVEVECNGEIEEYNIQ